MKINKEIGKVIMILIAVSLILITPLIAKWSQSPDLFISEETYYNIRIINQFHNNGFMNIDLLQQTDYSFNLFHFLMDKINLEINFLAKILPLIMGVLSLLLVYFLLKELELGENDSLFSMIIFSLTPVFIFTFTTFSPENLAFPLLILGAILYLRGNICLFYL